MKYLEALGIVIKKYRIKKGLKVSELGWYSDITDSYMSNIESGRSNMTLSVLVAISKNLDIPLSKIFKDVEKLMQSR